MEKEEKVKKFIESLRDIECGMSVNTACSLGGYQYDCKYKYHNIHFTLYVSSHNVCLSLNIENSKGAKEFLSKLVFKPFLLTS